MRITKLVISTVVLAYLLLGCNDKSGTGDKSGSAVDLQAIQSALYDLPSALSGASGQNHLARAAADTGSVWDTYRYVPAYVSIVQGAKETVSNFLVGLESHDLRENMEWQEGNMEISVRKRDTTILQAPQQFFAIRIRVDGIRVLFLNYWKNARSQYRGNLYFFQNEGQDSGAAVLIHFNGHNEETLGQRMVVTYTQPIHKLEGEKQNDPAALRVAALRKGDMIWVAGGSWLPNFSDPDAFWEEGAKIYAFKAVANAATDRAVLRVAFAPDTANPSTWFNTYSMDRRVLERGTVAFKTHIGNLGNDTLETLILWSVENEQPMIAGFGLLSNYIPQILLADITPEQLKTFLKNNQALLAADPALLQFLDFVSVEQPIFLRAGAIFAGSNLDIPTDFGLQNIDLESAELQELDGTGVLNLTPEDIVMEAEVAEQ